MRIHLAFTGKTAFPEIHEGIHRYVDRLRHYLPTDVHVIQAERLTSKTPEEQAKQREAERVFKLLGKQDYLIAWDQRGRQMSSEELAQFLNNLRDRGATDIWMVIGGPLGMAQSLLERANAVLSLSKMTLPHDLARLVVVEQLYRAFTILKGEPYHK